MSLHDDAVAAIYNEYDSMLAQLSGEVAVKSVACRDTVRDVIVNSLPATHPLAPVARYVAESVIISNDTLVVGEAALVLFRAAIMLHCGCGADGRDARGRGIADVSRRDPFGKLAEIRSDHLQPIGLSVASAAQEERAAWTAASARLNRLRSQAATLPPRPQPPPPPPPPARDLDMPPERTKAKRKAKPSE